ncbi:hypothetical protein KM043_014209 [Ampulex compressa]|nr:hypothetical protein KM043_014209 [Ampulex compressa]
MRSAVGKVEESHEKRGGDNKTPQDFLQIHKAANFRKTKLCQGAAEMITRLKSAYRSISRRRRERFGLFANWRRCKAWQKWRGKKGGNEENLDKRRESYERRYRASRLGTDDERQRPEYEIRWDVNFEEYRGE